MAYLRDGEYKAVFIGPLIMVLYPYSEENMFDTLSKNAYFLDDLLNLWSIYVRLSLYFTMTSCPSRYPTRMVASSPSITLSLSLYLKSITCITRTTDLSLIPAS